ncbi:hypothetical protein [Kribbella sp. NPDC048915]|uniref:hypothetical protein n=1 Tax=Kribbella sp. NPDC048915 TaxID=3155148 RepID=UPI0033C8C603
MTAAAPAPTRAEVEPRTVTLITGDRVTLRGPGGSRATIQPGEGRGAVTFGTYRSGNHLYVVPSDVSARVAKGTLDRRLFDVTALAEAGYGDELPLIVTYNGKAQQTRRTIPGATLARQLPVINGAALVVGKESSVLT